MATQYEITGPLELEHSRLLQLLFLCTSFNDSTFSCVPFTVCSLCIN
ncbi:hypothetical protein CSUI_004648 [Cystoisospora suis]|uniref:Uncharacterized protein n=1 Tax=Cystoisospora suis TaxID=483139 RepID=A0A2C6L0S7_9APIC|nr:hypothetical protein CSUI_004648 [Cystoisospora suis]